MTTSPQHSPLARRLGTAGSVVIGLGSMLGAGVFAAFAPAAQAAGSLLLVSLGLAAVVAWANALASAQLAAEFPAAGGSYVYGRELLGPWWGYLAGWSFVVGKSASSAAMALVFAAYVVPEPAQRWVAATAALALAAVNSVGITRTVALATVLVAVTLSVLGLVIVAGVAGGTASGSAVEMPGPLGIVQGAGFLFFAFAGYARVATLGEEVRNPARTIPRAITIALALVLVVYAAIGIVALTILGPVPLADSSAPLVDVVIAAGWGWAAPVVAIGAAAASLGALLALFAGIGRTSLAMARDGELPRALARVHPRFGVPHVAELTVGIVVAVVVLLVDLRSALAFSSFGVLLYYFVANVAAWRQSGAARRYPRALHLLGAVGCALLALSLPWQGVIAGMVVVAVGVGIRLIRLRRRTST